MFTFDFGLLGQESSRFGPAGFITKSTRIQQEMDFSFDPTDFIHK